MVKLFIENRKGVMDDFTDLLFLVLILSMLMFFTAVVLRTDGDDKTEQTLDKLASLEDQEILLDLVNSPALIRDKTVTMRDAILLTANRRDNDVFIETMRKYFEQHQLEGGVAVYTSSAYNLQGEPFLYYNQGQEKSALHLTNPSGKNKEALLVVVLLR